MEYLSIACGKSACQTGSGINHQQPFNTQFLSIGKTQLIPSEFEIRAVRENETDDMLGLMALCFGLPAEQARAIFRADPFYDIDLKRVLIERANGKILSCLTLIPVEMRLSLPVTPSSELRIGGIAGVCTLPEYRGQGLAGHLLDQTARDAVDLGFDLTALTAERPDYYVKHGWKPYGEAVDWCAPVSFFNVDCPDCGRLELLGPERAASEYDTVKRLYKQQVSDKIPGSFLRSEKRWKAVNTLSPGRRLLILRGADNAVKGYLAYDLRQTEVGTTAFVHEWVTVDPHESLPLLSFFAKNSISEFVAGRSRAVEVASLGLVGDPDIRITYSPSVYMRIASSAETRIAPLISPPFEPFLAAPDMF